MPPCTPNTRRKKEKKKKWWEIKGFYNDEEWEGFSNFGEHHLFCPKTSSENAMISKDYSRNYQDCLPKYCMCGAAYEKPMKTYQKHSCAQ
jgi:hypothetical protein